MKEILNQNHGGGFGGAGRRGLGGGLIVSSVEICVCLNCGYREPHKRGSPCNGKICPKCDSIMVRK